MKKIVPALLKREYSEKNIHFLHLSVGTTKRKEVSPKVAKGIPKAPTRKSSRGSRAATYEEVPDVEEESDEASDEEQQEEGA